jgi:NAD(P)-dependent dehydrogenase (short-subunit alcohol dehydrogenase family)
MPLPALAASKVAVVTGGASGIGLAAARRFAQKGMKVAIADLPGVALDAAIESLIAVSGGRSGDMLAVPTDVSRVEEVQRLRDTVTAALGPVNVLVNNAGVQPGSAMFGPPENWSRVIAVNLWGVVNGTQVFAPGMVESGEPGLIINTGSKQGITTPPGDPAYNVSKAAVKAFTEALEHELRNTAGGRVHAHLLIPGFVFTGLTAHGRAEKPAAAWTSEQTVDFMLKSLEAGDFYILCPDNDVDRRLDERRIAWAMGDIIENRPALSRWHPDYAEKFAAFVAEAKRDEGLQVAALNASNDD